jgi:outer membrane autotransporter protein
MTNAGAGVITARTGILVSAVATLADGISNAGQIAAANTGIRVGAGVGFAAGSHIVNTGTITGGVAAIDVAQATSAVTIDQVGGAINGAINLSSAGNADFLNVFGGTINGNVTAAGNAGTVNFILGSGSFTYAAAMTGLEFVNFNSGTVFVDGSIHANFIDVNSGGTAGGIGTLAGAVLVTSGGTLMPGNPANQLGTLHITGSLTVNAGSFYAVNIAPGAGNNSSTAVTGNAAITGGTVVVTPRAGQYNATDYVIVSTTGGRSGTFAGLTVNGFFTGSMTLDYTTIPGDVLLDVSAGIAGLGPLTAPPGLSIKQQNVLNAINNAILSGQTPPPGFLNLFNLSGPQLAAALTQLSGENSAGFFQGAFQAGNSFLGLMVNPFLDGRFGSGGGFGAAMGFAADEPPALPQAALAFASAMPVKAAPAPASFEQRFSVWSAAYGGSGRVLGDPVLGSHDNSASTAAFAAGIDYRLSRDTLVGFALAGGGTSWNVTAGLGGGSSDMFQAGVYASHHWGAAYLSGAIAYNFHDVTTNRTLTIAGTDMLQARFQTNGVGVRLEGGYRYATPWLGITPYAAAQVQSIALPNYGETATAGSNQFALNFASQTATTTRTEFGAWLDRGTRMDSGALLTLYGRAAWAHDFGNSPSASAIFQALPGSNFIVNGAVPARDGALVTGAAQYSLASGWAFLAKFDGEFSSTTSVYSGSGMVKRTW